MVGEKFFERLADKLYDKLILKSGTWALVGAILLVAFNYWSVIDLSKLPISWFTDLLYFYIIVNASSVSIFGYLDRKERAKVDPICPHCKDLVLVKPRYHCPNCGDIKFEKT